jgi:hypothetical protein
MRLLGISDSLTSPSGFGGVTREFCRRLVRRGDRLEIPGWQNERLTACGPAVQSRGHVSTFEKTFQAVPGITIGGPTS